MRVQCIDVLFQEVPGEIAIAFSITGCSLRCHGCHSPELWSARNGQPLTEDLYLETLMRYQGLASCVLFLGGEWYPDRLVQCLMQAREMGYKTCLYTGEDTVPEPILLALDFVKLGRWIEERAPQPRPSRQSGWCAKKECLRPHQRGRIFPGGNEIQKICAQLRVVSKRLQL